MAEINEPHSYKIFWPSFNKQSKTVPSVFQGWESRNYTSFPSSRSVCLILNIPILYWMWLHVCSRKLVSFHIGKEKLDLTDEIYFPCVIIPFARFIFLGSFKNSKSSPPKFFVGKDVLKICSKFTWNHPCRSVLSIKLQSNFIWIIIWYSPVNLLHISEYLLQEYLWRATSKAHWNIKKKKKKKF